MSPLDSGAGWKGVAMSSPTPRKLKKANEVGRLEHLPVLVLHRLEHLPVLVLHCLEHLPVLVLHRLEHLPILVLQ